MSSHPADAQTLFNLGVSLLRANRAEEAVGYIKKVVMQVPASAELQLVYAQALLGSGKRDQVVREVDYAVDLSADQPPLIFRAAALYKAIGEYGRAVVCFKKLAAAAPNEAAAHSNLGNALTRAGRYEEAFTSLRHAIELKPGSALYRYNYGRALEEVADYSAAEACYRAAIELKPDFAEAHWSLAQLLWLQGDMQAAWKHYEMRLFRSGFERRDEVFSKPMWDGRHFKGKTLLLYGEQGHGDAIQFVRYAELIKARGGRLVVECLPALTRLFQSLTAVDEIVERGKPLPPFDYQLSMMSAPVVFHTSRETIPGGTPYLFARRQDRIDLSGPPDVLKVGLVWAGNPDNQPADSKRSFPVATYDTLLQLPGIQFYSLQVGKGADQLVNFSNSSRIINLGPQLQDFATTAAVVEQLDLVITSCTSMPHLVGALNREAWLILSAVPDFRWFLEGDSSPWYPSLRLFRQKKRGDWAEVMATVRSCLSERAKKAGDKG